MTKRTNKIESALQKLDRRRGPGATFVGIVDELGQEKVVRAFNRSHGKGQRQLDAAKLPEALVTKIEQRRRAGYRPYDYDDYPGKRWELVAIGGGIWPTGCLCVFLVAAIPFPAAPRWDAVSVAIAGVCTILAAAAGMVLLWVRRHPLHLTDAEYEAIERASYRWPRDRKTAWREARLVGAAELIAEQIRSSPAWKSPLFDVHRARIDLDETLRDIDLRAYRVWQVQANTRDPRGDSAAAAALREHNRAVRAAADQAWATLVDRVQALHRYRNELTLIEDMLHDLDLLTAATSSDLDTVVRQLHVDAAVSEFAAAELGDRAHELVDLRANLHSHIEVLRRQLAVLRPEPLPSVASET